MDQDYQAGMEGLKYAADKGLAVIVMEPLKGGKLINPPNKVLDIWNEADIKRSPADWALRWIYNLPEVSVVLSGMSNLDHVIENISTTTNATSNSLTPKELAIVDRVKDMYKEMTKVGCTDCGYCMPCPAGVNIPRNFSLYNDVYTFDGLKQSSDTYNNWLSEENRASSCVECGQCEEACPQNIEIIKHLKDVHSELCKK